VTALFHLKLNVNVNVIMEVIIESLIIMSQTIGKKKSFDIYQFWQEAEI